MILSLIYRISTRSKEYLFRERSQGRVIDVLEHIFNADFLYRETFDRDINVLEDALLVLCVLDIKYRGRFMLWWSVLR